MINQKDNPVGWAMFLAELNDAHEHLGNLIKEMAASPDYSDVELAIDLGHVYSHLNRAWHRRAVHEDLTDSEWEAASQFPRDLTLVA